MEAVVTERLLLAEDESGLAGMLVDLFGREGYVVDVAADGQAMLHLGLTRHSGMAIFFSSHDVPMVRSVADRLLRVGNGKTWWEKKGMERDP